jgi:hypothetical protein
MSRIVGAYSQMNFLQKNQGDTCRLFDCLTANYAIAALRTDCTLDKMESALVTSWSSYKLTTVTSFLAAEGVTWKKS